MAGNHGKKLPRRAGQHKAKWAAFHSDSAKSARRLRKLKRVLKSCGRKEACRWAKKHEAEGELEILRGKHTKLGRDLERRVK